MRAVQLEAGGVVIERGRLPGRRAVAVLASGREAGVAGIPRGVVVALMASEAVGGGAGVAVAVARGAGHRAMRAAQLEAGRVVIEGRRLPRGRAVATLAGVREAGMTRIARPVVVRLVTGEAVGRGSGIAVGVAGGAGGGAVGSGELEAGGVVVEGGRLPGGQAVAVLAAGGKTAVPRVAGAVVVALVAGEAVRGGAGVPRAMAVDATGRAMRPAEREAGVVVVEQRRLPGGEAVAFAAGDGEAGMQGIARAGEVGLMTREALDGRAGIAGAVAERALDRAVRAEELECRLVVIESRRLPAGHAVAIPAAGGKSGMHGIAGAGEVVLMAVDAVGLPLLAREFERRVAELAGDLGVPAGEVEPGFRVPVGQRRPERRPALSRMAFDAFVLQRAVRIRRSVLAGDWGGAQQKEAGEPPTGDGEALRERRQGRPGPSGPVDLQKAHCGIVSQLR